MISVHFTRVAAAGDFLRDLPGVGNRKVVHHHFLPRGICHQPLNAQPVVLFGFLNLLALFLAQIKDTLAKPAARDHISALLQLPKQLEQVLKLSGEIEDIAARYFNRSDFLYLGRGINYPIALEGALKLKEISYIHAEGYPAGEMKHGPIALIDSNMPVVTIAPNDHVFDKMLGNIQEVKARGGSVIAVTTEGHDTLKSILDPAQDALISLPRVPEMLSPIAMVLPLQLLAYHIAVRRGCDVDQPRNLAKSVTVE